MTKSPTITAYRTKNGTTWEFTQHGRPIFPVIPAQWAKLGTANFLILNYQQQIYLGYIYKDDQGNKFAALVLVSLTWPKPAEPTRPARRRDQTRTQAVQKERKNELR